MRRAVILFLILMLLAGCAGAPSPTPTATSAPTFTPAPTATGPPTPTPFLRIVDDHGRTVVLKDRPQRIVTLAPSATEMIFAVGAGDRLVGRDELSDYPPEAKQVPSIGNTYPTLNTEAIVALRPDLILAPGVISPEQVKALEDLGLTVFHQSTPKDLEGIFQQILTVGRLTGNTAQAEKVVADLRARVAALEEKIRSASSRPKVFYELDATDPGKPWTAGPGSFIDRLITMAGGQNVGAVLSSEWGQLSLEELLRQDPDLIILGTANYGETPEKVRQRPGWNRLRAVREGRIYPIDADRISRPGPRIVEGLEAMARIIHPELFPQQVRAPRWPLGLSRAAPLRIWP
jgi:iron complex transport system substrate-binding protein